MTPPRIIVTRPEREAGQWVRDLRARGFAADALPLIVIQRLADAAARAGLRAVRQQLGDYQAAMFVSSNAVWSFFDADLSGAPDGGETGMDAAKTPATRAWATGSGTARALAQTGWPPERIDAPDSAAGEQADSEALWARVQSQIRPGARVLIVRGSVDSLGRPAGRTWLAGQLFAAGARVTTVGAYRRAPPVWDAAQQALARAAMSDGSVWLVTSSEAAANLLEITRAAQSELDLRHARAIATHPRVAQAARAAGFGAVAQSAGPALDAVIRSIESFT